MPEDEEDETGVFEQITLEDQEPTKDQADEAGGHDPYNSIPDTDKTD